MLSVGRKTLLRVGDRAPEFTGVDQNGRTLDLRDFRGQKNVVLFFYPKDFTAGCTAEVCAFRDQFEAIVQYDAVVIGVSGDNETSHQKFSSAYALPYYLVSDGDGSIGEKYGAFWLDGLFSFMKRITYIIDKEGMIRGVFRHELRVSRHIEVALACLARIQ